MTQTEELRALLDERGVEYTANDGIGACETSWGGFTAFQLSPNANLLMAVTPQQAVAATLGRPTWRNSYDQKRYDRWYGSLFHGEPTNFKELVEDIIWTCETVDLGPNGNTCQSVDEGEVNTESLIDAWARKAATLGEVDEGCYLVRDGKRFPVELDYGFLGMMPITITVGGFRYLVEVPDGE